MTDYGDLKLRARAQNHDLNPDLAEKALSRRVMSFVVEADAAAGTTIAQRTELAFPASEFPNGVEVKEIQLRTDAAVTESTSVYATDTFSKLDVNGANGATVATLKTNTVANGGIGTTVAEKKYNATLDATVGNRQIAAGGCLTLTRAKASTGTQLPRCTYTVVVEAL